jgi:hypothetical protein
MVPLAEPERAPRPDGHHGPDILPFALGVQNEIIPAGFFRERVPVLRAEIGRLLRKRLLAGIVNVIVEASDVFVRALVGDGDDGVLMERHRPVAVVAVAPLDLDGHGLEFLP